MLIKEHFRRPFVREYSPQDWTVENPELRKGVFITIPRSDHGSGNKPIVSFDDKGVMYGKNFEIDNDEGNLTIFHPENSFTPPQYKSFIIRIT